ncbi:MAG: CapA family protein [Christensenellales bacterium]
MKKNAAALVLSLLTLCFAGCSRAVAAGVSPPILPAPTVETIGVPKQEALPSPSPEPEPQREPEPEPEPEPVTVTLRVVGDIMLHEAQQISAKTAEGYDFSEYFARISAELSCADLTIGNLETPVANQPPSGYPRFNAPAALLDELKSAGFDAFTIANNHILDKGATGLSDTIDRLSERELLFFGASKTEEDYKVLIVDVRGVKIALLGYTYGTNGHKDAKNQVRYLTESNMKADVAQARKAGADFIIAFPHWGAEYHQGIHSSPARWAKKLANAEVDLILGSHPHVLEPMEKLTAEDGREVIVVHSMGNFISNQQKEPTYAGAIIEVVLTMQPDGSTALDSIGWLPTFVYRHPGKAKYKYEVLCADAEPVEGMNASAKRRLKRAAKYAASRLENDFAIHLEPRKDDAS